MKILYFNYMTTAFASILRSLEYAKAASDQGHDVTLVYLHPGFRPPAFYYDLMESYRSDRFHVFHPPRPPATVKTAPDAPAPAASTSAPAAIASDATVPAHGAAGNGAAKGAIGKVVDGRPTLKGLYKQILGSLRYVPAEKKWIERVKPDVLIVRPDHVVSFMVTSGLRGLPLVLECDGPVEELDRYWGLDSRWVEPMDTWRARRAEAVLYISRPCGDLWREKGLPAAKLFYTPNAAHPDRFKPAAPAARRALREKYGLAESKVFGFSGNLRSWHGADSLIAAALPILERDPSVKLLFIGAVDDPGSMALQNVPERIRKERLVFTGPLPYARMGEHIDMADAMVIPYPHSDFFYFSPMKLFEAMCLGKLIVAPHLGQIEEMLGDLASPILYEPREAGALARSLEAALQRIAAAPEGALPGADARARIEAGHTWSHRGKTVAEACEYALAQRAGGRGRG